MLLLRSSTCRNVIFRRNFPIRKIFERSCELGLWKFTADKISRVFGILITKQLRGKLNTTLEKFEHGHHIFRANFEKRLPQAIREVFHFSPHGTVQQ